MPSIDLCIGSNAHGANRIGAPAPAVHGQSTCCSYLELDQLFSEVGQGPATEIGGLEVVRVGATTRLTQAVVRPARAAPSMSREWTAPRTTRLAVAAVKGLCQVRGCTDILEPLTHRGHVRQHLVDIEEEDGRRPGTSGFQRVDGTTGGPHSDYGGP